MSALLFSGRFQGPGTIVIDAWAGAMQYGLPRPQNPLGRVLMGTSVGLCTPAIRQAIALLESIEVGPPVPAGGERLRDTPAATMVVKAGQRSAT